MQISPMPVDEDARLLSLHSLQVLDTKPEERFDRLTKEVVEWFSVPICTISIIDRDREWFKSCQGLPTKEGKREISFCGHAMLSKYIFIVEDTKLDPRFSDNPYVVGPPFVRFYAGMALRNRKDGQPIGVLCIKDTKPRTMSAQDIALFIGFANRAEEELNSPYKIEKA
ncbi:MAG: GAF domain-containing protein [Candidatus Doudnabacteria bacterium]|nr:GAF domain-containing protein [Candidatus Doudnabacteria bacterium]